jgi:hypothetical protein
MLQSLCLSDFRGGGWPDKGGLKVLMKSIEKNFKNFSTKPPSDQYRIEEK